ncbi:hypothetical protein LRS06_15990 [Hymenobacter sp. J193]|uniref:hypothetical protein n=1 Tax=Hymenobacter sp. J193 TaxID=2898429 RepID=UPI002150DF97|nr:hypothetical protein [Hymenobacter sp. J193]MCR5889238.1 hypothetical protein [Hymenobacter sp. J193]
MFIAKKGKKASGEAMVGNLAPQALRRHAAISSDGGRQQAGRSKIYMKKRFSFGHFLFIAVILAFVYNIIIKYETSWSREAQTGRTNLINIKRIHQGMTSPTVLAIMGHPESIDTVLDGRTKKIWYSYSIPPGSSASCSVIFDTTTHVHHTYVIEE